eukprot:m.770169 g.770169  ORF g.770169 m.770169 type:complete len:180 (-) comp23239_c0_seq3:4425-4964(-)
MSDAALDVGCAPNLSENSSTNRQGDIGLVSVSARSSFTQPESGQESTSPTSEAESGDTSSETGPAQDAVEDATNEHGVAADADGVISMSKNALIERPLVTTSPTIATSTSTENDMDDTVQKRDMMYQVGYNDVYSCVDGRENQTDSASNSINIIDRGIFFLIASSSAKSLVCRRGFQSI